MTNSDESIGWSSKTQTNIDCVSKQFLNENCQIIPSLSNRIAVKERLPFGSNRNGFFSITTVYHFIDNRLFSQETCKQKTVLRFGQHARDCWYRFHWIIYIISLETFFSVRSRFARASAVFSLSHLDFINSHFHCTICSPLNAYGAYTFDPLIKFSESHKLIETRCVFSHIRHKRHHRRCRLYFFSMARMHTNTHTLESSNIVESRLSLATHAIYMIKNGPTNERRAFQVTWTPTDQST